MNTHSPWLLCPHPHPQAMLRLFCIPFAGGAAGVFHSWAGALPASVEVRAVELPGRGTRRGEPAIREVSAAVGALADAILPLLDRPYALFGHSMGALLAFALAREMRDRGAPPPRHLFASGRRAPHLPERGPPTYLLADVALKARLRRLEGMPDEALADDELMQLVLPTVRADLAMDATYRFTVGPPLDCPLTALGGQDDPIVREEDLGAWSLHTGVRFAMQLFPGGHFFFQSARNQVLQCLSRALDVPPRAPTLPTG